MGGRLICGIIEKGQKVAQSIDEIIISPQSDMAYVRTRLSVLGYEFLDEDMVKEDGKYYNIMKLAYGPDHSERYDEVYEFYGRYLIEKNHPVLKEYLKDEQKKLTAVLQKLGDKRYGERYRQIMHIVGINNKAQEMMGLH